MAATQRFILAAVSGVAAHLTFFIRGEWHMQASLILIFHVGVFVFTYLFGARGTSDAPFLNAVIIHGGYASGLFGSMVAYRLSPFHRLHSFPGPRMAAVSKLWHFWQILDSRNHELMTRFHKEYQEHFIRTGPSELTSFHPDSYTVLEGHGTQCSKDSIYDMLLPDKSLLFTRDMKVHNARLTVWNRALNSKAIATYRGRIDRQIRVLIDKFSQSATNKEPVLINDIVYWFAFDSMGGFAFNRSFGMMESGEWHSAIKCLRSGLSLNGPFISVVWLIRIGFDLFPWFWRIADWKAMMKFCHQRMDERRLSVTEEPDVAAYFIEEAEKTSEDPFRDSWLRGDGATLIVAGSDTTAPTLTFFFYCLAQHPEHQEKLFEELSSVDISDVSILSALPHLNACINESMRLYPVAATSVSRETPTQGVTIGNTYIPGNVNIVAPRWVIFRLESCFPQASEFIPERWYSRPELLQIKDAFAPFGLGRTRCVGKELAQTQLRLVTAAVVKNFILRFPPGEDGREVLRDLKDQVTTQPGKLRLLFEHRV